jgi:hypothetical protein
MAPDSYIVDLTSTDACRAYADMLVREFGGAEGNDAA